MEGGLDVETVTTGVTAGLFIAGLTWVVASFPARYGGLAAFYLSEGQLFVLIFLLTGALSWLFLSYIRIAAPVFILLAIILPFMTFTAHGALHGVTELHPAAMILALILSGGFFTGIALRKGGLILVKRYPRFLEPIAESKWALLLIAGVLLVGFGAVHFATAPTPTVSDVEPGYERSSSTLEVAIVTEPGHYRVLVETPTGETFHDWIARPEFRNEEGNAAIRIATPNVAPSAGTYSLSVETIFGNTIYETELAFDQGPNVVVSEFSIDEDGSIVTVELENTGDLPAPLWDHDLYIDGELHKIAEDDPTDPILPGDTTEIRGEIGHHPHGELETVTLEPGTYEIRFELRATNRDMAIYTDTVEITSDGGRQSDD